MTDSVERFYADLKIKKKNKIKDIYQIVLALVFCLGAMISFCLYNNLTIGFLTACMLSIIKILNDRIFSE